MSKFYRDYCWKEGVPYGIGSFVPSRTKEKAYKIAADPYRKRITVELYEGKLFCDVVYDSLFLDFRKLKPEHQHAWQKEVVSERSDAMVCHIRDQDDRLVYIEEQTFYGHLCRKCLLSSPHGVVLSSHVMLYKWLGDDCNKVYLYDKQGKPVMSKEYDADPVTGDYTTLLSETWNVRTLSRGSDAFS